MFLTAYNLPHYLISKGIISAQSVVDGDLVVTEAGRRNRNFKIIRRKHPGLFVKQVKTSDAQAATTLRREAAFYRVVASDVKYSGIRDFVPVFVNYDERRHSLTINLVGDSETVGERILREGGYRDDTAQMLGQVLGRIHSQGIGLAADPGFKSLLTWQPPWPLTLDQSGYGFLDSMGAVGPHLSAAIRQHPTLQPMLTSLRSMWRYDSLIHGDMKWDNCLVTNATPPQLTIVDWELVDMGDGAWDVAAVFKEYVIAALLSVSNRDWAVAHNQPAPQLVTLQAMQPAARAFWQAYVEARRLPDAAVYLDRAVRLTGARMMIAILEYLFTSSELGSFGGNLLQTGVNILQSPQLAAAQLLGTQV